MAKLVLTNSASSSTATPTESFLTKVTTVLPVSVNTIADQFAASTCSLVKWNYTLRDTSENKTQSAEITATHRNGANPIHTRYAITGDSIPHTVTVVIESGQMRLRFVNQDPHTLIANILRTLLTP